MPSGMKRAAGFAGRPSKMIGAYFALCERANSCSGDSTSFFRPIAAK
jgi:hypothetical protein